MRRMPQVLIALTIAGLGLVGAGMRPGSAETRVSPVLGPDFRISGPTATWGEYSPAVAWGDAAGEYLVVWQDGRNFAARNWDLYARRVAADGARVGGDIRISGPSALAADLDPAVAWNGASDEFLVVWVDRRSMAERGSDIYGRRVGAAGIPAGDDFRISGAAATVNEEEPAVAYNPAADEYLVVWSEDRNYATRGWDIYGRLVGADGVPVGGDFRISGAAATAGEDHPAVAYDQAAGEYLVVWSDGRNYATRGDDIYGRRVSAGGATIGADFRVSGRSAAGDEDLPSLARGESAGEYLVVWMDSRAASTRSWDIYGRRVGAGGAVIGPDFRISGPNAVSVESGPVAAWSQTAAEYQVVWADWRNLATRGGDVYGRRVGSDGSPIGGDFRISGPNATAEDYAPAVAWNAADDQYLVVWQDSRNFDTRGVDVYGRRLAG